MTDTDAVNQRVHGQGNLEAEPKGGGHEVIMLSDICPRHISDHVLCLRAPSLESWQSSLPCSYYERCEGWHFCERRDKQHICENRRSR